MGAFRDWKASWEEKLKHDEEERRKRLEETRLRWNKSFGDTIELRGDDKILGSWTLREPAAAGSSISLIPTISWNSPPLIVNPPECDTAKQLPMTIWKYISSNGEITRHILINATTVQIYKDDKLIDSGTLWPAEWRGGWRTWEYPEILKTHMSLDESIIEVEDTDSTIQEVFENLAEVSILGEWQKDEKIELLQEVVQDLLALLQMKFTVDTSADSQ